MFNFKRHITKIELKIEPQISGADSWYYTFTADFHDEPGAQLVMNAIEDNLEKRLKKIRSDAYEEGWKDAKAKRKRADWFSGWW